MVSEQATGHGDELDDEVEQGDEFGEEGALKLWEFLKIDTSDMVKF